jgi:hypothetical protein
VLLTKWNKIPNYINSAERTCPALRESPGFTMCIKIFMQAVLIPKVPGKFSQFISNPHYKQ